VVPQTTFQNVAKQPRGDPTAPGDVGFSSANTYDLEVWLPGRTSTRRSLRARTPRRSRRGGPHPHEFWQWQGRLRSHAEQKRLRCGRTRLAIVENWQQADGSVVVPEVLRPFPGVDVIRK
jgi:seryl-tRNA synthetase